MQRKVPGNVTLLRLFVINYVILLRDYTIRSGWLWDVLRGGGLLEASVVF